jgi:hypothetical protein
MQIAPNGAVLEGVVRKVTRDAGGFGRELVLDVQAVKPMRGLASFMGPVTGNTVRLFLASEEPVKVGEKYRVKTAVLGGPGGERTVVQSLVDLKGR